MAAIVARAGLDVLGRGRPNRTSGVLKNSKERNLLMAPDRAAAEPVANVGFWHEAAVRKCPLLRRLWGLSGHRSAIAELSSIYEFTP